MKIRVFDTDGIFRGGQLTTDGIGLDNRKWPGTPRPNHAETLIDLSSDKTGYWFLLRISHTPDISGSKECDDEFDANSYALRYSPEEASHWLKENGYDPPPDLVEQANLTEVPDGGGHATAPIKPLSERQEEVWSRLNCRILSAKEIATDVYGDYTKEDAVRKVISAIRGAGREILHVSRGYYRPDAPPPDNG